MTACELLIPLRSRRLTPCLDPLWTRLLQAGACVLTRFRTLLMACHRGRGTPRWAWLGPHRGWQPASTDGGRFMRWDRLWEPSSTDCASVGTFLDSLCVRGVCRAHWCCFPQACPSRARQPSHLSARRGSRVPYPSCFPTHTRGERVLLRGWENGHSNPGPEAGRRGAGRGARPDACVAAALRGGRALYIASTAAAESRSSPAASQVSLVSYQLTNSHLRFNAMPAST